MLPLPGGEATDDPDGRQSAGSTRCGGMALHGIGNDRVVDDASRPNGRQGVERGLRVRDDGCRKDPCRSPHEHDRAVRQIVVGDPIAEMPDHRDASKTTCRSTVQRSLQRVRVHEICAASANASCEADDVRRYPCRSHRIEAAGAKSVLAKIAQRRRQRQHLHRYPVCAQPLDERPLLTENDVDVDLARQRR